MKTQLLATTVAVYFGIIIAVQQSKQVWKSNKPPSIFSFSTSQAPSFQMNRQTMLQQGPTLDGFMHRKEVIASQFRTLEPFIKTLPTVPTKSIWVKVYGEANPNKTDENLLDSEARTETLRIVAQTSTLRPRVDESQNLFLNGYEPPMQKQEVKKMDQQVGTSTGPDESVIEFRNSYDGNVSQSDQPRIVTTKTELMISRKENNNHPSVTHGEKTNLPNEGFMEPHITNNITRPAVESISSSETSSVAKSENTYTTIITSDNGDSVRTATAPEKMEGKSTSDKYDTLFKNESTEIERTGSKMKKNWLTQTGILSTYSITAHPLMKLLALVPDSKDVSSNGLYDESSRSINERLSSTENPRREKSSFEALQQNTKASENQLRAALGTEVSQYDAPNTMMTSTEQTQIASKIPRTSYLSTNKIHISRGTDKKATVLEDVYGANIKTKKTKVESDSQATFSNVETITGLDRSMLSTYALSTKNIASKLLSSLNTNNIAQIISFTTTEGAVVSDHGNSATTQADTISDCKKYGKKKSFTQVSGAESRTPALNDKLTIQKKSHGTAKLIGTGEETAKISKIWRTDVDMRKSEDTKTNQILVEGVRETMDAIERILEPTGGLQEGDRIEEFTTESSRQREENATLLEEGKKSEVRELTRQDTTETLDPFKGDTESSGIEVKTNGKAILSAETSTSLIESSEDTNTPGSTLEEQTPIMSKSNEITSGLDGYSKQIQSSLGSMEVILTSNEGNTISEFSEGATFDYKMTPPTESSERIISITKQPSSAEILIGLRGTTVMEKSEEKTGEEKTSNVKKKTSLEETVINESTIIPEKGTSNESVEVTQLSRNDEVNEGTSTVHNTIESFASTIKKTNAEVGKIAENADKLSEKRTIAEKTTNNGPIKATTEFPTLPSHRGFQTNDSTKSTIRTKFLEKTTFAGPSRGRKVASTYQQQFTPTTTKMSYFGYSAGKGNFEEVYPGSSSVSFSTLTMKPTKNTAESDLEIPVTSNTVAVEEIMETIKSKEEIEEIGALRSSTEEAVALHLTKETTNHGVTEANKGSGGISEYRTISTVAEETTRYSTSAEYTGENDEEIGESTKSIQDSAKAQAIRINTWGSSETTILTYNKEASIGEEIKDLSNLVSEGIVAEAAAESNLVKEPNDSTAGTNPSASGETYLSVTPIVTTPVKLTSTINDQKGSGNDSQEEAVLIETSAPKVGIATESTETFTSKREEDVRLEASEREIYSTSVDSAPKSSDISAHDLATEISVSQMPESQSTSTESRATAYAEKTSTIEAAKIEVNESTITSGEKIVSNKGLLTDIAYTKASLKAIKNSKIASTNMTEGQQAVSLSEMTSLIPSSTLSTTLTSTTTTANITKNADSEAVRSNANISTKIPTYPGEFGYGDGNKVTFGSLPLVSTELSAAMKLEPMSISGGHINLVKTSNALSVPTSTIEHKVSLHPFTGAKSSTTPGSVETENQESMEELWTSSVMRSSAVTSKPSTMKQESTATMTGAEIVYNGRNILVNPKDLRDGIGAVEASTGAIVNSMPILQRNFYFYKFIISLSKWLVECLPAAVLIIVFHLIRRNDKFTTKKDQ